MRLFISCLWLLAIYASLTLRFAAVAQEAEVESVGDQEPPSASDSTESPPSDSAVVSPEKGPAAATKPVKPWEAENEPSLSGPDIYHLPDESGNLRKVLGFRYEDFLNAWRQMDRAGKAKPPNYLFDSIRVSGEANDSHANLQIEFVVLPQVDGWINVPLELPALMVQQWEIDERAEEECLVFDAERKSYVLWLKNQSDQPRTFNLQGLSKLKLAPTTPGLELKLPHATRSEFVLNVPIADARFEVSPGVDVKTSAGKEGGTEVRLTGQARPLRLQWTSSEQQEQAGNTAIQATGHLEVQIDRHLVSYDAELTVDSFGDPLERLRIRLPVGAKLTREDLSEEYRVVEQELDPVGGDIVEIELPESTSASWTLRLSADQSRDVGDSASEEEGAFRVTGFEVLNALRQSGTLALHVDERLQAYFDTSGNVEQTSVQEGSSSAQPGTPLSGFAYSRFPWALEAHTLERQLRVSVEPQYQIHLNQGNDLSCEAELQVQFEYQFAGAKTFAVRMDMRGWELGDSPIESEGAIDLEKRYEKSGGLLVLPLVDPNAERLRVSMTVRRSVPLGHSTIPLPTVQEAFILPGKLTVESDPSLQLTPTIVATEGVSVDTDLSEVRESSTARADDSKRDVLYLRTFLPRAALSAEIKQRERQVAVAVETEVDVAEETIRVLQQLKYDVKYRPTSLLLLRIPEPLWDNQSLKVQLDGEALQYNLGIFSEELPRNENGATSESPAMAVRQLRVSLPRPRQNDFQLDISYEVPCPALAAEAMSPLVLPLISPDDQVESNEVGIFPTRPIHAMLNQTVDEGPWIARTENESTETETASLQIKGSGKPTTIPLFLQIETQENVDLPTLQRAWLQTWIVGSRQQIRAVFLIRTTQKTVVAQLPPSVSNANLEILLDGSASEFNGLDSGRIAVQIPDAGRGENHTLEIRYQRDARLSGWGILNVSLPRLECRPNVGHVFWQLVLPKGWHAANTPHQLAAEYRIGWNNTRWGRQPTFEQSELEDETDATTAPKPPASSNQYLYSGFMVPRDVNVIVVSHLWLIVTCILIVFGAGMFFLYTSVARHVTFWLVLSMVLLVGALTYPEFALIAVQAIFWGGAMTLATLVLQRTFSSSSRPGYVLTPTAKSASTAVTESWIHGQPALPFDEETETTSIQASGPTP